MLSEFIAKQLQKARYKLLGDGTYFGEIPGLRGVWGNAKTLEGCRRELQEVLESWVIFRLQQNLKIPGFPAPAVRIDRRALARHA